uniref:Rhodanese domain-containing protein n=1 Tax=Brassica oleracea var. oleracea TaxID=109376 RepID=A0A0D3DW69_BRAOL
MPNHDVFSHLLRQRRSTIRSVLTASRPSFLLFSVRRSILTASRPSSFLFSVKRSIETHLSLTLSHTTILFCSPVLASTAPFTSISDQSTVNAFRNLKFLGKSSVQVPYSGEDESRVLKRVKGSFSDQENTVVCVLDNFDGNSMKVAELLVENGFKEA